MKPSHEPGYVYVMINPAWPGWVKIGKTENPDERLAAFNASSPLGDYTMPLIYRCRFPLSVECRALHALGQRGRRVEREWVQCTPEEASEAVTTALDAVADANCEAIMLAILSEDDEEPRT